MADSFSSVTITFDQSQYNAGDKMTMTLSGQATSSAGSTTNDSPAVTVTASDGSTTVINAGPVAIAITTATNVPVTMTSISDGARQWVISADGLTATATA